MSDVDASGDGGRLLSYFTALECAGNGLIITDPNRDDNPIIHTNQVMAERCGMKVDEIIGQNCRFLQRGDRDQESIAKIRSALREQQPVETVLRNYTKSGRSFQNHLSIVPVLNGKDKLQNFVGIQYDVDATFRAEERMAECFSVLSHELRTPATSVKAVLDILRGGLPGYKSARIQRVIQAATESCETLTAILNELLQWEAFSAYATRLERRRLDVSLLTRDLVDQLSPLVESKGGAFELSLHRGCSVISNREKLKQVLSTLCIQALTSCPYGGKTKLEIMPIEENSTLFRITTDGAAFTESTTSTQAVTKMPEQLVLCVDTITLLGGNSHKLLKQQFGSTFSFELPAGDNPRS